MTLKPSGTLSALMSQESSSVCESSALPVFRQLGLVTHAPKYAPRTGRFPARKSATIKLIQRRPWRRTCERWRPALKRGGPGNDALRVELRRSSSPNVGMRGAGLKLPGFKDPATEIPMPPERSYSARAALCCYESGRRTCDRWRPGWSRAFPAIN